MPDSLPTPEVIAALESRQEEVLGKLAELEQQIEKALADFTAVSKRAAEIRVSGKQQPAAEPAILKFPTAPAASVPAVKVA
jgi:hypothetical protein